MTAPRIAPRRAWWGRGRGPFVYFDQYGPEGVSGWIAPSAPPAVEDVVVRVRELGVRARLTRDGVILAPDGEARGLFRFQSPAPWRARRLNRIDVELDATVISSIVARPSRSDRLFWAPARASATTPPAAPAAPATGRTLVYFAPIDWRFRRQRSQQLAEALSANYDAIWYVGPLSVRVEGAPPGALFASSHDPIGLPMLGGAPDVDLAERRLAASEADAIADTLRRMLGTARYDVIVQFPAWAPVTERLAPQRRIYDCIDQHAALPHVRASIEEEERALIASADLCVASSATLEARLERLSAKRVVLAANAAPPVPPSIRAPFQRRTQTAIYLGAVEAWFDFDMLAAAAERLSDVRFEIIGRVEAAPPLGLPGNVDFVGEREHADAMRRLRRAKVGLIPFKAGPLVDAVDPVKAYEYLAAGLPVVSTPMPGANWGAAPGIRVARTPGDFAQALADAFADTAKAERRAFRDWAARQTWSDRAAAIASALAAIP